MRGAREVLLAALGLGLLVGASACLEGGHGACHRRALEALGCCPFHSGDCAAANLDDIAEACSAEIEALDGETAEAAEDSGTTDSESGAGGTSAE